MKNILIIVGIVVLAIVGYWLWSGSDTTPPAEETTPDVTVEEVSVDSEPISTDEVTSDTLSEPATDVPELDKGEPEMTETPAATEGAVREFTLDSFNFGYSMDTIEVNEGDTVTINLTSSDGFHDWVVDEFDAATEKINVGEETSVTFVADEAGTFEFYCSVGSHRARGMVGTLVVN
jgi:plastocyanin